MIDERLDAFLREAREPEPEDDGFTEAVVRRIQGGGSRRGLWRRYVTRPAVLAAAAALVAGGAFAAVNTSDGDPQRVAQEPAPSPAISTERTPRPAGPAPVRSAPPVVASEGTDQPATHPSKRHGDLEWGYTSPHTAYVHDHGTGLRLETETYANDLPAGEPHRVTLTLRNTSDEPVGVAARQSCALTVAAHHGHTDPTDDGDPRTAKHPSEAKVWNCAGSGDRPTTSPEDEPERFVLAPGEQHVADAMVVLPDHGDWWILGRCECMVMTASETTPRPEPTKDPDGGPLDTSPHRDEEPKSTSHPWRMHDRDLFTPPIQVEA